jgi:hypothetical protein
MTTDAPKGALAPVLARLCLASKVSPPPSARGDDQDERPPPAASFTHHDPPTPKPLDLLSQIQCNGSLIFFKPLTEVSHDG